MRAEGKETHVTASISQIILGWVALDAEGNVLDNPATNFNSFEKGWNITGSPLAPGHALGEVSPAEPIFSHPAFNRTRLMLVAMTFADGSRDTCHAAPFPQNG